MISDILHMYSTFWSTILQMQCSFCCDSHRCIKLLCIKGPVIFVYYCLLSLINFTPFIEQFSETQTVVEGKTVLFPVLYLLPLHSCYHDNKQIHSDHAHVMAL